MKDSDFKNAIETVRNLCSEEEFVEILEGFQENSFDQMLKTINSIETNKEPTENSNAKLSSEQKRIEQEISTRNMIRLRPVDMKYGATIFSYVPQKLRDALLEDDAHGIHHALQVTNIAIRIAKHLQKKGEEIDDDDLEKVELSALLHDIGNFSIEEGNIKHLVNLQAEDAASSFDAFVILKKMGKTDEEAEEISSLIRGKESEETLIQQVVSDADNLLVFGGPAIDRIKAMGDMKGKFETMFYRPLSEYPFNERINWSYGDYSKIEGTNILEVDTITVMLYTTFGFKHEFNTKFAQKIHRRFVLQMADVIIEYAKKEAPQHVEEITQLIEDYAKAVGGEDNEK